MLKAINDARKELLRLRKNQNDPGKLKASSAAQYVKNYLGHKKSWNNWQKRLNDLLGEFNNKNCDPQSLPNQVSELSDQPYPDMPVGDFVDHWKEGMKQTFDDMNDFVNDPRNWLGLLLTMRGGGRMPVRIP